MKQSVSHNTRYSISYAILLVVAICGILSLIFSISDVSRHFENNISVIHSTVLESKFLCSAGLVVSSPNVCKTLWEWYY